MKLNYDRKSKNPTYFVQIGFRHGKKVSSKNVFTIGKHNDLLAEHEDPLAYSKSVVAKMNEEAKSGKTSISIILDYSKKLGHTGNTVSKDLSLNVGYFFLQKIYNDLNIKSFIDNAFKDTKITYSANDANRFLTFARILDPRSKLGTFDQLDTYYEQPSIRYQHIERFINRFSEHYDDYIRHLFLSSSAIIKRDTSVCYYDCTNYYFEIEHEDPDYVDEVTGEVIRGFRKYGPSKQHQPSPLVQMGLFMDGRGIPISMCIHNGSDSEQLSAVPLEKEMLKMFSDRQFIYCADAGLGSTNIRVFNDMGGRAFIVTQSIKKLSDTLKEAVFNDCDYRLLSSNRKTTIQHMSSFDRFDENNLSLYNDRAYKVLKVDTLVDLGLTEEKVLGNGSTKTVKSKGNLHQRIIITYSRKMMEYQRAIRNAQIERARFILSSSSKADGIKKGPHDVTRFIRRTSRSANGDRAIDSYEIDQSVIEKEEMYDGYYAVATNLKDDAKDILAINSKRYKIEDCFRVMKTNFSARPVYHHNKESITAHFMICYTALLIYRLLECQLEDYSEHFTTDQIIETLKVMRVTNEYDMYYKSTYSESKICTALSGLCGMDLDREIYSPKDLNKMLKTISK